MWSYNYSNELYHWGIKGMKWGVRRYQNKDGSLTPAGEKRYSGDTKRDTKENWSDDAKNASKIKKKSVKQMSNQELRQLNERVRLEQEYARLNPNIVSRGKKVVLGTAAFMSTALTIYNNSDKLVKAGKKILNKIK